MTLPEKIEILKDATDLLEWQTERSELDQVERAYTDKAYFVAFIGRFSAGKSCLINSLLGEDLLPTGVQETTATLTYIRYGDRPAAHLYDTHGNVREVPIEAVRDVRQRSAEWNVEDIESLEILYPSDLLRNGMVLVDTPGVDTIIERHNEQLATSLAVAARIVYVTGGSPSKRDQQRLREMKKRGFNLWYVRTHFDNIRAEEEDPDAVMRSDQAFMCDALGNEDQTCFFVSNLPDTPQFQMIQTLRSELAELGQDAEAALEQDMNMQLATLARRCADALQNELRLARAVAEQNETEMTRQSEAYQRDEEKLRTELAHRRVGLKQKVAAATHDIEGPVRSKLEREIEAAAQRVTKAQVSKEEEMIDLWRLEAESFISEAEKMLNQETSPLIRDINGTVSLEGFQVEADRIPHADEYTTMVQQQDMAAAHAMHQLRLVQADIERAEAAIENADRQLASLSDLETLEASLSEIRKEIDVHNANRPQPKEVPGSARNASKVGRIVGEILDWALFFLPGEAVAAGIKGASNFVTKVAPKTAQAISKATKVVTGTAEAAKAAKAVSKGAKAVRTVDLVKDAAFVMKKAHDAQVTGERSGANSTGGSQSSDKKSGRKIGSKIVQALNMMTVSYWLEKACKPFDRPPKMEVNEAEQAEYERVEQELRRKELETQQIIYNDRVKLGVYTTDREREQARLDSLTVDEARITKLMAERKGEIERQAQQNALATWRDACAQRFRESMLDNLNHAISAYVTGIADRLEYYQEQRFDELKAQLDAARQRYLALRESPNEAATRVRIIDELLAKVEVCAQ